MADLTRLGGLMRKEFLQMVRDPASLVVAGVLPLILLMLFGYGVSLDLREVRIGVVNGNRDTASMNFVASLSQARFFQVQPFTERQSAREALRQGGLKAVVVLDDDFGGRLQRGEKSPLQVLTNGTDANTARLLEGYLAGVLSTWMAQEQWERGSPPQARIAVESRMWFNPALKSRFFLVPGLMAIIISLVGTLLTALVVAREWERGTMEALLATPVSIREVLLGKLVPYYVLGMGSIALVTVVATQVFGVPLRGSWWLLALCGTVFLVGALSLGLLISTLARDQFVAAQIALVAGFMPSFMLSGFIFEISSAPVVMQWVSAIIPATYFIRILQTLFLSGTTWSVILPNLLAMAAIGAVLVLATVRVSRRRLE